MTKLTHIMYQDLTSNIQYGNLIITHDISRVSKGDSTYDLFLP
jgi:hypothetical protein